MQIHSDLIKGYSDLGSEPFAKKYGLSTKQIANMANKLGLKLSPERKLAKQRENAKIRSESAQKAAKESIAAQSSRIVNNKIEAYLLGYLWGDSYMVKGKNRSYCNIECLSDDMDSIYRCCDMLSLKYSKAHRTRKNRKPVRSCAISSLDFNSFLTINDFSNKSSNPPTRLLKHVDAKLHYAFVLGLLDADGCWYCNTDLSLYQLSFSSSLNYDWGFLVDFFQKEGVNTSIQNIASAKGGYSALRVVGKKQILCAAKILYQDNDIPFLQRKRDKLMVIGGH